MKGLKNALSYYSKNKETQLNLSKKNQDFIKKSD